jgi:GTP pyrophosphokinase
VRRSSATRSARLVDGVTKLDKVKYGDAAQAETVRKMVVAMARDIRVLVIKLADRLHNARTWRFLAAEKQEKKARETLEIYAPLAHRLGMNTIKWELEDLSFATLYPKMYDEIVRLVADRAPSRDEYLAGVTEAVTRDLREAKIKATVTGRPKHYYSIYQKMIVRGRELGDIYDLVGIRVLVESVRDCYAALGTIHARWNPCPAVQGLHRDAQVQHVPVAAHDGDRAGRQAGRAADPHLRHAPAREYGIAAHWKYKEKAGARRRHGRQGRACHGRQGRGQRHGVAASAPRLAEGDRGPGRVPGVAALRPVLGRGLRLHAEGRRHRLPAGSTPVDFAYAVHTEVGHRCIGARVNGRLVPLESTLDNGDLVEVFTSKAAGAGPSRDWLSFVASPRARNKIRQWFSKERREEAIEHGKDAIARAMRKQGLPLQRLLSSESLTALAHEMRYADISALYAAVGEQHVSAQTIVQRLGAVPRRRGGRTEDIAEATTPTRAGSAGCPPGG